MSRLGKKPLAIPAGVKVTVNPSSVIVEGKLGTVQQDFLSDFVEIQNDGKQLIVNRKGNTNNFRACQGLYWRLIRNQIIGVSEGFQKLLNIQGLGYKWDLKGKDLNLVLGFSHPVSFQIPEGISLKLEKPDLLSISGCDKHLVGQTAANIRAIKPPEPYKGKGIRYSTERIKLKEGKSAK